MQHIGHFTVDAISFAYLQPLPKSPKSTRWGQLSPLAQRTAVRSYLALLTEERGTTSESSFQARMVRGDKCKVEIGRFNLVQGGAP